MTLSPECVTACLVTRGDVDMHPILDSLIFPNVIVWDNSERSDLKVAGRYQAAREAKTRVVYFQDDDVIVPPDTQRALVAEYEPGVLVSNWAHGDDTDGLDDVAMVGAGAIVDRRVPRYAEWQYLTRWPLNRDYLFEADFVVGVLAPHRHVHLPFEIRDVSYNGRRLCDEPWQRELKHTVTERARRIRDGANER